MTTRRQFLVGSAALAAAPAVGAGAKRPLKRITIAKGACELELFPLKGAFGFKGVVQKRRLGGWHVASCLTSTSGARGIGLANEGCVWSDVKAALANSGCAVEAMMYAMTRHALTMAEGKSFTTPPELIDQLFPELLDYGRFITGRKDLRATFALNALVSVDFAAWVLFARENGIEDVDGLVPDEFKAALPCRHPRAASIPLVSYAVPIPDVVKLVDDGYFFMKIKIGQGGTQEEMLAKDKARLSAVHAALKDRRTPYTASSKLPYYFDANGRYEKKETLLRLLNHAEKIGALEQIAIIEEPFDELNKVDVSDIPVRLASDEAAHTPEDAQERIALGYRAMALKPIAKTLSVSMRVAEVARRAEVPCFCADLTVSPVNVEWNKLVAGMLPAFPGLGAMGLVESNGHQNYAVWDEMCARLPDPKAPWVAPRGGVYDLGGDYWKKSGYVLEPLKYYEELFS